MCMQRRVSRRTRVRAIAWVCARPLWASRHPLPQPPSGGVQRRVYPACAGRATLPSRPRAWRAAPGTRTLLVLGPQASPSRPAFSVFPGLLSAGEERSGAGSESSPTRAGRLGWQGWQGWLARAAPPLPPPPRRPDGFFHDCIRPRAVFVPASPPGSACERARLSRARRRAQPELGGAASPSPVPPARAERDSEVPCGGAKLSPDAPLWPSSPRRQGLRPLSPIFVRKVDGHPARVPLRFVRRPWRPQFLWGGTLGSRGWGAVRRFSVRRARTGLPLPPAGMIPSCFSQGAGCADGHPGARAARRSRRSPYEATTRGHLRGRKSAAPAGNWAH